MITTLMFLIGFMVWNVPGLVISRNLYKELEQ